MQVQEVTSVASDYQVSVFGSPIPTKMANKVQTPTPLPPVRTYSTNKQCTYDITFPPGAMGLELEPVITSSERTIGCRVKDYYFGMDYNGIDRVYIEQHIATGDIVTRVNETPVVSMPFGKILDLLRSLVETSRTVSFKNITASWEEDYRKEHATPSSTVQKERNRDAQSKSRHHHSHWADSENAANGLITTMEKSGALLPVALQQLKLQQQAAMETGTSALSGRKTRALSPKPAPGSTTSSGGSTRTASSTGSSASSASTAHSGGRPPVGLNTSTAASTGPTLKSPPANRSLQKLLGYPVAPLPTAAEGNGGADQRPNESLDNSSTGSPFRLRRPSPNDSANRTFSFSVQDVDDSVTVQSIASPKRSAGGVPAQNSPAGPQPKLHLRSQSFNSNAAVLMLQRTSSGTALHSTEARSGGSKSPLTPSSILRLKQLQRANSGTASPTGSVKGRSSPLAAQDGQSTPVRAIPVAVGAGSSAEQSENELESGPIDDEDDAVSAPAPIFSDILQRVRGTIGSGLVQVGTALGARAEQALIEGSYLLPLYSATEMNQVMSKKYDLLNELSQSCVLLGEAEERKLRCAELESQTALLEDQVRQKSDALEHAEQELETHKFKLLALETELSVLKGERAQELDELQSYKEESSQWQQRWGELQASLKETETRASQSALQCSQLQAELRISEEKWSQTARAAKDETATVKADMHVLTQRLQTAERDRDQCMAELEVMQEMSAQDKQSAASELARMREAMASQQYLYKEQLIKRDEALHAARRELSEAQAELATVADLCKQSVSKKDALQAQLEAATAEIAQLTGRVNACELELRSSQEELAYQKNLTAEAQGQLKDLQLQLVASSSEHGMLSDQAKMAELTMSALHTEIGMLRREIEEQRDITKAKDIEVMTAISRGNTAEEELQITRLEMERLRQTNARLLDDNQEEVAVLEKTIAGLRAEAVEQARVRLELSEQIDQLSAQRDDLQQSTAASASSLQMLVQEREEESIKLQEQIRELEQELNALRDAHDVLNAEHALLTEHSNAAQRKAQEDVAALRRAVAAAEESRDSTVGAKEDELAVLRSKYGISEEALNRMRTEIATLVAEHKQEVQRKDSEIVALAESRALAIEQLEVQAKSFEDALAVAKARYEQREKEFVSALGLAEATQDSLRDGMRAQLAEVTTQCDAQKQRVAQLEEQLIAAQAVSSKSAEDAELLGSTISVLTTELSESRSEVATLEAKLAEAQATMQRTDAQCSHLKSELDALQGKYDRLSADNEKQGAKAQAESVRLLDLHAQETALLQTKLNKAMESVTATNATRASERAGLVSALRGALVELAALKSNLSDTREDVGGLQKVHGSIVKSLVNRNQDLLTQLSAQVSQQPGAAKLEGRLMQLLQEKEAANRRAGLAEQNTIDSEARCVNALTRALAAEQALSEAKGKVSELREALAERDAAAAAAQTEVSILTDATELLKKKLAAANEKCAELQVAQSSSAREAEHLKSLLQDAQTRDQIARREAAEELQRLRQQLHLHAAEREEQERALRTSSSEQASAASRLQTQYNALQRELDAALQKASADAQVWSNERQSLQEQADRRVAELLHERNQLDETCAELRLRLSRTEENAQTAELAWQMKLTAAEQLMVTTKADLQSELEQQASALRDKLLQQEHQFITRLEAERTEAAAHLQETVAGYEKALLAREKAHGEATSSQQQHYKLLIAEMTAERERIEAQLDAAQLETDSLRTTLTELNTAKSELVVKSSAGEKELVTARYESVAAKEQALQLRGELAAQAAAHAQALQAQTEQLSAAQQARHVLELEVASLRRTTAAQEQSIREEARVRQLLEKKLELLKDDAEQQKSALAGKEQEVTSLRTQIVSLEDQLVTARDEEQRSRAERANVSVELQAKVEEIVALQRKLVELEGAAGKDRSSVTAVMQDLEVALERKKDLKQQLDHAQLAQRAAEKQVTLLRAQVQELRSTLTLQQAAIADAETRETEHMANKSRMESIIAESEARFTKLQAEFTQLLARESSPHQSPEAAHLQLELQKMTAVVRRTQRAFDDKCAELESLHMHVTELLSSTTSPLKEALSARKRRQEQQAAGGKENVLSELSGSADANPTAANASFVISEASEDSAAWHGRLVDCSLQMYELLIGAFQHMKVLRGDHLQHRDTFTALEQLCVQLSLYQHRLHNILAQTPWSAAEENRAKLAIPHEVSRTLTSPVRSLPDTSADHSASAKDHANAQQSMLVASPSRVCSVASAKRSPDRVIEAKASSPASPPLVRTVPMTSYGEEDHDPSIRASNDSITLDELLASLASSRSAASSNNSSMCSSIRVTHRREQYRHNHEDTRSGQRGRHAHFERDPTEDALTQATRVSTEIGEVSFDSFGDSALGATPPSIQQLLRSGDSSGGRSSGSKGSRRNRAEDSFDSVVSDLFNLSADTVYSDEDSAVFNHYQDK